MGVTDYGNSATTMESMPAWAAAVAAALDSSDVSVNNRLTQRKLPTVAKTANYTLTASDEVVLCDGTFTVTLPTAVGAAGKQYVVRNINTGTITIARTSSQTVDGCTGTVALAGKGVLVVVSDGANWLVVQGQYTDAAGSPAQWVSSQASGATNGWRSIAPTVSPTFTGTVTFPTGAVTSAAIADGTIVDADINASAAIAQSKVANLVTNLAAKSPLDSPVFTTAVTLPNTVYGWGGNLLTVNQSSFETDLTGWSTSSGSYFCNTAGATTTRDTTTYSVGAASAKVVTDGSLSYQGFFGTFTNLQPNTVYTAYCRLKRTGTGTGCQFNVRDATSSLSYQGPIVTSSNWTPVYLTFVTGASTTTVTLNFTTPSAASVETFYVDAVGLWQGAGGVWSPPGQIIQNLGSYTDETVGRRVFMWDTVNNRWQMTFGDTGRRDLTAALLTANGFTAATFIQIRRTNNTVFLEAVGLTRASGGAGNFVAIASGFQEAGYAHYGRSFSNNSFYVSGGNAYISMSGTNDSGLSAAFQTTDAWPSSLPGTAVGSIPQ